MLTRTNAGTPAGELLRRYWQPVALSSRITAGGAPLAERVMGDDILIFRDEDGRLGVLAKRCAHRCADLSTAALKREACGASITAGCST